MQLIGCPIALLKKGRVAGCSQLANGPSNKTTRRGEERPLACNPSVDLMSDRSIEKGKSVRTQSISRLLFQQNHKERRGEAACL